MKFHIERDWTTGDINVFLFYRRGDRLFVAKPAEVVIEEVSDYRPGDMTRDKVPPFMRLSSDIADDFMAEFAKALSDFGYHKPKDEAPAITAELLKAKDAHLADMRTLVFKS